ncbi:hypothetical protein [Nocardia sp. NPDC019395]|uniref:hypothetical protein n=1 Tax=Nocardia sp. NPDC019395 TaxID=3154686 RepID=UPI0033CAF7F6
MHEVPGFSADEVTTGPFAHGFGRTGDGRSFAFRTVRATLQLEIYRADLDSEVPGPEDVVAVAETQVTDIDLDDARSVVASVRDLLPAAVAPPGGRNVPTVRALLARIGSVIEGRQ